MSKKHLEDSLKFVMGARNKTLLVKCQTSVVRKIMWMGDLLGREGVIAYERTSHPSNVETLTPYSFCCQFISNGLPLTTPFMVFSVTYAIVSLTLFWSIC
jgi:hypothetical protein